ERRPYPHPLISSSTSSFPFDLIFVKSAVNCGLLVFFVPLISQKSHPKIPPAEKIIRVPMTGVLVLEARRDRKPLPLVHENAGSKRACCADSARLCCAFDRK